LNNLTEYVLGGDPTTPNAGLVPAGAIVSNHFELTFPFNLAADDIVATVERATTVAPADWTVVAGRTPPGGWTNAADVAVGIAQTNTLRLQELLPANGSRVQFFRLRYGLTGN